MDVREKLDQIRRSVETARAMPMSASCVINRADLLTALSELSAMLPSELADANRLLAERHGVIDEGRAEAGRLVEEGRKERDALIHRTDIYRAAQYAADELRTQSQQEAEDLRRETDDYVDQKLAGFEIALQKTLATVQRGRDRLAATPQPQSKGASANPQARRETDEFVTQKLDRFEDTLRKSLDSVARGRERLRDRSALDNYGVDESAPPLPG